MHRIDAWLICRFERFAHWFQRMTGLDCFWLAKNSFILKLLSVIILIIVHLIKPHWLTAIWFLNSLVAYSEIRECEKLAKDYYPLSGTANVKKITNFFERWCSFAMVILDVSFAMLFRDVDFYLPSGWAIAWALGEWFSSCDPLPPCQSKIKEWLKSFKAAPKPVEVTQ